MAKQSVRRHTTDRTEGVSIESCFLAQHKLLEMTPQLAPGTQGGDAGLCSLAWADAFTAIPSLLRVIVIHSWLKNRIAFP